MDYINIKQVFYTASSRKAIIFDEIVMKYNQSSSIQAYFLSNSLYYITLIEWTPLALD
jgi:hypothetical protein